MDACERVLLSRGIDTSVCCSCRELAAAFRKDVAVLRVVAAEAGAEAGGSVRTEMSS